MLESRFENGLVATALFLLIYGIAGTAAYLVRITSKKVMGTSKYYAGATVVAVIAIGTLNGLLHAAAAPITASSGHASGGLDAPFIAPPESQMESFVGQLNSAIGRLPSEDKASVKQATNFLAFAVAQDMSESDPAKFAKQSDTDLVAHSLVKMYRFAQQQGSSMTLRKYVDLAEEFKRQKPEWWSRFIAISQRH